MATMGLSLLLTAMATCVAAEEETSPVDFATAATLLGAISVVMCLYYLLNWPDPDIRRYSYDTICSTISIFCAVLMFQSFQQCLVQYVIKGQPWWFEILMNFAHVLFWHVILQISLAFLTKVLFYSDKDREAMAEDPETMAAIEVNTKCWGTLLAHMTGFACINAFGSVQQVLGRSGVLYSFLAVPMAALVNWFLIQGTHRLRKLVTGSKEDKLEKLWDEEVDEAELDVYGLGVSFLMVQTVKFKICGTLANVEGEEPPSVLLHHTGWQCGCLWAFGMLCMAVFVYLFLKIQGCEDHEEEEKEAKRREKKKMKADWKVHGDDNLYKEQKEAYKEQMEAEKPIRKAKKHAAKEYEARLERFFQCGSMGMAWTFFYFTQWWLAKDSAEEQMKSFAKDPVLRTLALALVLSVCCFAWIFVLDKISDMDIQGMFGEDWNDFERKLDRCIEKIVQSFGILIGFSWEQTFDASVAALASVWPPETRPLLHLFMAFVCVLLIVPAWWRYMLPMTVHAGWHYGFIAHHATEYLDPADEDSVSEYISVLRHFITLEHPTKPTKHARKRKSVPAVDSIEDVERRFSEAINEKVHQHHRDKHDHAKTLHALLLDLEDRIRVWDSSSPQKRSPPNGYQNLGDGNELPAEDLLSRLASLEKQKAEVEAQLNQRFKEF